MYNVEKYVETCIESILGQSYDNIEALLIDDGSPDRSGAIADEYSAKFEQVKVVHIENGGVSAARNLGLQYCCGDYVVFVDADDYLAPDYVEYMYGIIEKTNADFVMSRNCFKFPGNKKQVAVDQVESLTSDQAATELLYPENIDIGCWNKMFGTQFLRDRQLAFPTQFFMGEGLNFIVRAAQLSNRVGVGLRKVYYYRRDNLDSATTAISAEKYINALAAIDHIEHTVLIKTPAFQRALEVHRYFTTFASLKTMLMTGAEESYPNEYRAYLSYLRKNAVGMVSARISILKKARMWIYCINPKLAHMLFTMLINELRKK